jgi:hypothetical protein
MLAVTHLIVSLLLINLLTLDRNDSFVALLFGVFIDVDHLFGLRGYVEANGIWSIFDVGSLVAADGQWKSVLHSPVAAIVVGPVASASRLAIPLLFWGVHVSMDCVEDTVLGLFSAWEFALLGASSLALVLLAFRSYRMAEPRSGFADFLRDAAEKAKSPFRNLSCAVSRALGR